MIEDPRAVIVGLGNPGQQYEMTRHNLGYLVVKAFARQLGWRFKEESRFRAFVAKGDYFPAPGKSPIQLHLLLPITYMNCSGIAVRSYLDYFKFSPKQLAVVMDDVALPFGKLRLRSQGGAGGHNGLKDIISHLGTDAFIRLRMGISGLENQNQQMESLADYVLSPFSAEETMLLNKFIEMGIEVLKQFLTEPETYVTNVVNKE